MKTLWAWAVLLCLIASAVAPARAETRPEIGYGQTPSQTMQRVFLGVRIRRVNLVEPYAIVSASAGTETGGYTGSPLFGSNPSTEFLLEHFDFGWQVIEMARSLCSRERGITPATERMLMAGMPKQNTRDGRCEDIDSGPARSVSQVRKLMYGPVVPFVRVLDNYAFSEDFGDGGGCGLFHFDVKADRWKMLSGCKGMMPASVVEDNHIPLDIVCAIHPAISPEPHCPKRKKS